MGSSTREVVTLQLGHYANFVGTHWWNIQSSSFVYKPADVVGVKEINTDVLFREGQNLMGEITYTPRLIAFDLKGSLNTLKADGTLYDVKDTQDDIRWPGDVTLHTAAKRAKNSFLADLDGEEGDEPKTKIGSFISQKEDADMDEGTDEMSSLQSDDEQADSSKKTSTTSGGVTRYGLDDSVNVWSDFLRPYLHPRTLHIVNEYQHDNEQCRFDTFGFGEQLYKDDKVKSDVEDRLRFFAEECDNLQGFQLLVDTYDGFGGLACSMLEDIADDYSNKAVLCFATTPAVFPETPSSSSSDGRTLTIKQEQYRMLSAALSYDKLVRQCSMLLPLSMTTQLWRAPGPARTLSHLDYKAHLSYHTSAVLGATIDTMTLPYRLESNASHMSDLTSAMTPVGRKVVSLQSSFPLPLRRGVSFVDTLAGGDTDHQLWSCLTPGCASGVRPDRLSVVLRGATNVRHHLLGSQSNRTVSSQCDSSTIEEILAKYTRETFHTSFSAITCLEQPCKVIAPYPHIFSSYVDRDGRLSSQPRTIDSSVESVAMMTSLECSTSVKAHLDRLHDEARKLDVKKLHRFLDAGLEADELGETLENLKSLSQCYTVAYDDMS